VKVAILKRYRTVLRTVPFCTVPYRDRNEWTVPLPLPIVNL